MLMRLRDEINTWQPSTLLMFLGVFGFAIGSVCLECGAHLWAWWTGRSIPSWNPFELILALASGELVATTGMWVCVAGVGVLMPLCWVAWRLVRHRIRGGRRRGDEAATLTGHRRDTGPLSRRCVEDKASRLEVDTDTFGLPVARAVGDGRPLYSDFEAVTINVSGPRTGKTTGWVVPRMLAAPGFVVATSNKADIVELTRQERARRGDTWVFDPQGITGESQMFWWNMLGYVVDAVTATAMAQVLMDASRPTSGQSNPFFDTAARDLVARFLLAASLSEQSLAAVKRWINDPNDDEAVTILRDAGEREIAGELRATLNLVEETRSGIFAGAQQIMAFTANSRTMAWVTPNKWLQELHPERLVASTDTLYLLSQEGPASAAPVVTALTMVFIEAAMQYARHQPKERLSVPGLVMLDEAANVCRWGQLPDLYSHFGSRAILVETILQSWSQGVVVWGEAGMKKLWSASNVKVYGGGVTEVEFLSMLSDLIGTHYIDSVQTSSSQQGSSTSTSLDSQERKIAPVSALAALPQGRAWVLAPGSTPVLSRLVPFWDKPLETTRTSTKGRRP